MEEGIIETDVLEVPEKPKKPVTIDRAEEMAEHLTSKGVLHGRQLLKELPLFIIEPWAIGVISFVGILLVSFELLGIVDAAIFGISTSTIAFFFVLGAMVSLYLIKRVFYLPTGNRTILERVYATGGSLLSAEKVPVNNEIDFDKEGGPTAFVQRINESFDISTGRPKITCIEGYPTNVSVYKLAHGKITEKFAQKFSDIVIAAKQTTEAKVLNDYMNFGGKNAKNWTMLMVVLVFMMSLAILAIEIGRLMQAW